MSLIEFKSISKKFGDCWANQDISFSIQKSTIHGLIGENGAGKSTIMKILFGLYSADSGEILIAGKKVSFSSPLEAFSNKIGMVHQHFMLSKEHTAMENLLLLDKKQKFFSLFNNSEKIKKIKSLSEKYHFNIPWNKKIKYLPVGIQQKIEILKLLSFDHEILIFDEPTAVLTPQEIDELLNQLIQLKNEGKTIIIISHKLKEIKKITDSVTVFRKGQCVGTYPTQDLSESSMAELMVGRHISFIKRDYSKYVDTKNPELLELKNIQFEKDNLFCDFNINVSKGEIVGIAGIEGNGQNHLIEFLLNPTKFQLKKSNSIYLLNGTNLLNKTLKEIRQLFVAIFPEDRLEFGVLAEKSATENFILGYHRQKIWTQMGIINWKKIENLLKQNFEKFQVTPKNLKMVFSNFSGGNQQKIVVARELFFSPKFIISSHPTRGVDIGAIEIIHEELIRSQESGTGILLISSELDELIKLSDRIYVMNEGKIVKSFEKKDFNEIEIGKWMLQKERTAL